MAESFRAVSVAGDLCLGEDTVRRERCQQLLSKGEGRWGLSNFFVVIWLAAFGFAVSGTVDPREQTPAGIHTEWGAYSGKGRMTQAS